MKLTVATPQKTGQVAMLVGLMVTQIAQLCRCYNYMMAVSLISHGFTSVQRHDVTICHPYLSMSAALHAEMSPDFTIWPVCTRSCINSADSRSVFIKYTRWQFLIIYLAVYFPFKECCLFSIAFHVSGQLTPHAQYFQCSSVCVITSYLTFFFPHLKVNTSSFSAAGRIQQ